MNPALPVTITDADGDTLTLKEEPASPTGLSLLLVADAEFVPLEIYPTGENLATLRDAIEKVIGR